MDATASIDMAMWSAAAIGMAMAVFRMISEFAEVALDGMDIGHSGKKERPFFDGFLIVLAVLLSGFCVYQLVTDKAAAMDSLLFWFGAAAAILCGISGMILLRANANSNDS